MPLDEHEHVEVSFAFFPGMALVKLFAHDGAGVDLFKDVQADVVAHLVIKIQLA